MRVALFQPDIPQNTGAILRLGACLDVAVDLIEPCGFLLGDRHVRRAGLDYRDLVRLTRHASWDAFLAARPAGRLVLLTTKADRSHLDFDFVADDTLLLGRESAGVPDRVHDTADGRVLIPMVEGQRSINVALSAAMICGEALRQTGFA